jgi:hypothetical protein
MIRQSTRWFREFIERHLDEAARTKMKRVCGVAERLTFLLRNLLKFFSKTQIFLGIFASGRVAIADSKRASLRGSRGRVTSAMRPEHSGRANSLHRAERTRLGQRHVAVEKAERSA